ncbi:MAG: DMT family transporter, partial [Anaerolineae bacterium]
MGQRGNQRLAVASFFAAGVLWGVGFPFGKVAFEQLGPAQVVALRFVLAAAILLPIPLVRRVWPRRRDLPLFLAAGVLTVPVTYLLQFVGLQFTTAANAALIMGATAPMLAIAAVAFYREHLSAPGWVAVATSSLGVVLIVGQPQAGHGWGGDVLVFLSAVTTVGSVLASKELVARYPAVIATAYIIGFGTLFLVPAALLWEGMPSLDLSPRVWGAVLILGVGCSALSNLLYNWGLGHFDASRAGVFLNLEPLVGAILGVAMLHEAL